MKKILLLSTAILAVTTAASAQVTTKGELGFTVGNTGEKDAINRQFSVTGELSNSYVNDSKAGFSWGASWDFDWTAKDDSANVTASDSQIYIDTEFGKLTMGQGVDTGLLNDAADSIFATALNPEAVMFSDSYAGLKIAVAMDDNDDVESAFSYTIAGLTFAAASSSVEQDGDDTKYAYGISGTFAALGFELGFADSEKMAYEFEYNMAGLGITVSGKTDPTNEKGKNDEEFGGVELTYDIASGMEASISYDDSKDGTYGAGLTVSF